MATLTGNLADVTNKAPENISSITVKAPAARIGGSSGSSVIVSSPATVDFNSSTGDITISNLTGGLSWMYIEGDGWSDSIAFAVADGMTTLVEAVANASGVPGIADYIRLLADLEGQIEDVAQDAVDAAVDSRISEFQTDIGNAKSGVWVDSGTTLESFTEIPPGLINIPPGNGLRLGHPTDRAITIRRSKEYPTPTAFRDYAAWRDEDGELKSAVRYHSSSGWSDWSKGWEGEPWVDSATTEEDFINIPAGLINVLPDNGLRLGHPTDRRIIIRRYKEYASSAAFSDLAAWRDEDGELKSAVRYHSSSGWSDWSKGWENGSGGNSGDDIAGSAAIRHRVLEDHFRLRRGGTIGTGGLPAVALRFDHHLAQFRDLVLPELQKHGLPWAQVLNPENIGTGNDTATLGEVQEWAIGSGGEVWNHGGNHADAVGEEAIHQQIVGSLHSLQDGLPSLHIDGWVAPGIANGYDGHILSMHPEQWADTYAGKLVYGHHAALAGHVQNRYFPLNGQMTVGMKHASMDTAQNYHINNYLNALLPGQGLIMMFHPSMIDQSGRISLATVKFMLEEIARRRDRGELRVLSYTGMFMADADREDRVNLIGSTDGTIASTQTWEVDTYQVQATAGVVHEVSLDVEGTAQVTVTVSVDGTALRLRTIDVVDSGRVSMAVTPPKGATATVIRVSTTSEISYTKLRYRPV